MASNKLFPRKTKAVSYNFLLDQIVHRSEKLSKNSIKADETALKLLELIDNCQGRWKKVFIKLKSIIRLHKSEISRLTSLQEHTQSMLEVEVQKRRRIERSKRSLEKKINVIRQVLMENDVDTAKKQIEAMNMSVNNSSRSSINPGQLDHSAGSLLDPMNVSADLDATVNYLSNNRISKKTGRASSFGQTRTNRKSINKQELRCSSVQKFIARHSSERGLSPNQVPNNLNGQRIGSINRLNRPHNFVSRTFLRMESCSVCGRRIMFGKAAFKCLVCRLVIHPGCRLHLNQTCVPPSATRLFHTPTVITPQRRADGTAKRSPMSKHRPTGTGDLYLNSPSFIARSGSRNLNLTSLCPPDQFPRVPALVIHCVNEIMARGLNTIGLYRISGSEKQVRDLFDKFMRGKGTPSLALIQDTHVLCGCLKLFLRNLDEPLVTFAQRPVLVSASEQDLSNPATIEIVQNVLLNLVPSNRDTLSYVMLHLKSVASSSHCQMGEDNLSKIFGPTLVGYSCPEPQPMQTVLETRSQQTVVRLLFSIPDDFYSFILANLKSIPESTSSSCVPTHVDDGGLVDDDHNYFSPINVKDLNSYPMLYTPSSSRYKHVGPGTTNPTSSMSISARKRFFPNLLTSQRVLNDVHLNNCN